MNLYTIGFTKKSARTFFEILHENGIECVVDIRLHPGGQLAGFTKKDDLQYFLAEILGCEYRHFTSLAPGDEMLRAYRKDHDWDKLERAFLSLLDSRDIPATLDRSLFEEKACCLLCSEATPDHCHRRLVAQRLASAWPGVDIIHL